MATQANGAFGNHPVRRYLNIVVDELIVEPVWKPSNDIEASSSLVLQTIKYKNEILFTRDIKIYSTC